MGLLLTLIALVCAAAILVLSTRGAVRTYQRDMRHAAWPWARAYYALRDGDDTEEQL